MDFSIFRTILLCAIALLSPKYSSAQVFTEVEHYKESDIDIRATLYPDLNGDGFPDALLYVDDYLLWHNNLTDGTFGEPEFFYQHEELYNIEVFDYEGDGDLDVFASTNTEVIYLENDGLGQFEEAVVLFDDTWNYIYELAHLNDDLLVDFVLIGSTSNSIYLGDAADGPQFLTTYTYANSALFPTKLIAHFSSENHNDLVYYTLIDSTYIINIARGNGNGSFALSPDYVLDTELTFNTELYGLRAVDLNGDGLSELVLIRYNDESFMIKWNGTSFEKQVLPLSVADFTFLDLNGDGLLDILHNHWWGTYTCNYQLSDGSFSSLEDFEGVKPFSSAHGLIDFNLDGAWDLVINSSLGWGYQTSVFDEENCSSITFAHPKKVSLRDVLWTDLDFDGDLDILAMYQNNLVWYENKEGAFPEVKQIDDKYRQFSLKENSVNKNGNCDYIACLQDYDIRDGAFFSNVFLLENDGEGNFDEPSYLASNSTKFEETFLETHTFINTEVVELGLDTEGPSFIYQTKEGGDYNVRIEHNNGEVFDYTVFCAEDSLFFPGFLPFDLNLDGYRDLVFSCYSFQLGKTCQTCYLVWNPNSELYEIDCLALTDFTSPLSSQFIDEQAYTFFGVDETVYLCTIGEEVGIPLIGDIPQKGRTAIDFNNDEWLDFISIDQRNDEYCLNLHLISGSDKNTLSATSYTLFCTDGEADEIEVADFDLDGDNDLIIYKDEFKIFRNDIDTPRVSFQIPTCDFPFLHNTSLVHYSEDVTVLWDFGNSETSSEINPNFPFDEPGEYTVSLTICNALACDDYSETFELNQVLDLRIPDSAPLNTPIQFENHSQGFTNISWIFNDGEVSTEDNPIHSYDTPGVYIVETYLTNDSIINCTYVHHHKIVIEGEKEEQNVFILNSVETPDAEGETETEELVVFGIFPNPTDATFRVSVDSELDWWEVKVIGLDGKVIEKVQPQSNSYTFNTINAYPGLYLVQVTDSAGNKSVKKVVVQH